MKLTMAPNSKPSNEFVRKFVDELNHHSNLDGIHDCPEALKPVLLMINRTRLGHEDLHSQLREQAFDASHVYDKQLMWRAGELARECSGIGMNKKSEMEWQSVMSPHVFLSLNNKDEERTNSERQYHHW